MKYRKKALVIDAIQFKDQPVVFSIISKWTHYSWDREGQKLTIPTIEGEMGARFGDYIIRGIKGEVYPCRADIFEATYEKVDE